MKPLICVIGMHRSGTSAVAGCLKLAGVDFGPEPLLMAPSPANPKGYFENLEVVGIHERLLRGLGGRWDEPKLRGAWAATLPAQQAQKAIANWLSRLNGPGPSGIKDPRMALFGPLWRRAAERADVDLRPLVVRRSIDAIARSLTLRDDIPAGQGQVLASLYGNGATDWLSHANRYATWIEFERLLEDPVSELLDAFPDLGLRPGLTSEQWQKIIDFVDPGLTHA
jgi:hypothetical protein